MDINNSIKRQFGLDEQTGGLNLNQLSNEQFRTIENLYLQMTAKSVTTKC